MTIWKIPELLWTQPPEEESRRNGQQNHSSRIQNKSAMFKDDLATYCRRKGFVSFVNKYTYTSMEN
jgi:hypothetical protein